MFLETARFRMLGLQGTGNLNRKSVKCNPLILNDGVHSNESGASGREILIACPLSTRLDFDQGLRGEGCATSLDRFDLGRGDEEDQLGVRGGEC